MGLLNINDGYSATINQCSINQMNVNDNCEFRAKITRITSGDITVSKFVDFHDGMTIKSDMPKFRGESDQLGSLTLMINGDDLMTPMQVGKSDKLFGDGTFKCGYKHMALADGTYSLFVEQINDNNILLGEFTINTMSADVSFEKHIDITIQKKNGEFVEFTDDGSNIIDTNTVKIRGESSGYRNVQIEITGSEFYGIKHNVGGNKLFEDGTFKRAYKYVDNGVKQLVELPDGTYDLSVKDTNHNLGSFTVDTSQ